MLYAHAVPSEMAGIWAGLLCLVMPIDVCPIFVHMLQVAGFQAQIYRSNEKLDGFKLLMNWNQVLWTFDCGCQCLVVLFGCGCLCLMVLFVSISATVSVSASHACTTIGP